MHSPWKTFPHISLPIQMLDPASAAPLTPSTDSEARSLALLALARPVLKAFAAASTFPELLTKQKTHRSLGNLGDYLVGNRDQPELGEAHRALLMDETVDEDSAMVLATAGLSIERPKVTLHNKGMQRLLPAQVDDIEDPARRLACVPIRSQPVAALVLHNGNRGAEVRMLFSSKAAITLRKEASEDDKLKLSMVITSMKQQRKIIMAILPSSANGIVEQLFSRARTVALAPGINPRDDFAKAVVFGEDPNAAAAYYEMPFWFEEQMGVFCEQALRVHALFTAAHCVESVWSKCAENGQDTLRAKLVTVDKVTLHEQFDPKKYKRRGLLLKVVFHATSSVCICGAHHRRTSSPPRRVVVNLRICGHALTSGQCPVHSVGTHTVSETFPGFCCSHPDVEIACEHNLSGMRPSAKDCGIRIPVRLTTPRMRIAVKDLVCGAASLSKCALKNGHAHTIDLEHREHVSDLRLKTETIMTRFAHACVADKMDALVALGDERAVDLLCQDRASVKVNYVNSENSAYYFVGKTGTERLKADDRVVALTHGHLFKLHENSGKRRA